MQHAQDQESAAALVEAPAPRSLGLYIHIPFCARKCPYCDFNTYAGMDALHGAYVRALCTEIARAGELHRQRKVDTVFLGGGTPTVLQPADLERILGALRSSFALTADCEISSEANPSTVDPSRFGVLRAGGVNRLSLGVQSLRPRELEFLGRDHGVDDVQRAVDAARSAGFERLNLDLMYGLSGQTRADWRHSLAAAIALEPDHLSLYSLVVEADTPLALWVSQGKVAPPDDDDAAQRFQEARAVLDRAGYIHYEIANWTRGANGDAGLGEWTSPSDACRHNLRYWRNEDFLGFGPGAHSCLHRPANDVVAHTARRWWNIKGVRDYIRRINATESVVQDHEELSGATAMAETMMLSMRLVREGLPYERFRRLHGRDLREVYAQTLSEIEDWGLVELGESALRLSQQGLPLGNQVFERFLP